MNVRSWGVAALVTLLLAGCAADRATISADDVRGARAALEEERAALWGATERSTSERITRMIELGLWREADSLIAVTPPGDPAVALAEVQRRMKEHDYHRAEAILYEVLEEDPLDHEARLLAAELKIQAWELDEAEEIAERLLQEDPRDEDAAILLGRIRLLEKRYDEALELALQVQRWNRRNAEAYALEADVRFWEQDPAGAEPALIRALELNPFDPDARFNYGYAIWRRVDATLLDDMAAQWELALELDPLHYVTHWHWGNGHTNLTYADYAHPTDSIVRERLLPIRELIARGELEAALRATRELDEEFPESVLPAMLRGSAFYMAYDMEIGPRLDSAQATFQSILDRKEHYGPAHNGLAAVIKHRQFLYLSAYDSLEAVIDEVPIPDDPHFERVFRDLAQYPGTRVEKMVRHQLGPAVAYLPMIDRIGAVFTIPPLHVDLAEAMNSPRLRTATTFDNRQWMDIRGVGSGSTGLEYVERGSHWERNVTSHEYAHLFHGRILTDAENRRIRDLYHRAMEEGRTLDYYASNNESEYFAQIYEAYISPVKVHPLNHKALNTLSDLEEKDPAGLAFLDSLVQRMEAYLAGDVSAVASNWAHVYTRLSEQERRRDRAQAVVLLDSALIWDPEYIPAHLSYAALHRDGGDFDAAAEWLARAEALDPDYAPIYSARAALVRAEAARQVAATGLEDDEAFQTEIELYQMALELEDDLAERARLNQQLRNRFAENGMLAEAIEVAEEYVVSAPTISTYLRDRRDDAAAFAAALKSEAGYANEVIAFFSNLVGQKPQHYELRKDFARALTYLGRYDEAITTLEEAQRILRAGGNPRADYMVQTAEIELLRGDTTAARSAIGPILEGSTRIDPSDTRLIRVLASLGEGEWVADGLRGLSGGETRAARADLAFTRGWVAELEGRAEDAVVYYNEALTENRYHRAARVRLVGLLEGLGRGDEARASANDALELELPAGPDLRSELGL